jgi:hypothetical protein
MLEDKKAEAQQALDELFNEQLLPFKLSARRVQSIGLEEYIVRFDDSRLSSIDVSWVQGEAFKDVLRDAVLQRLRRMHREPATAA